jgi:NAD(P)-dependent dehydrogenase (short-subunit alcohol dehydrogenase family)
MKLVINMRNILLTGSSSGLGIVLAKMLLEEGNNVILHYFNNKNEVEELHNLYPNNSILYKCDIRSEAEVHKMYEDLKDKNIDCLINNAAIDNNTPLEDKTVESFINVYKTNLIGPFLLIKYFGNDINAKDGSIVNISSDDTIDSYDEVTIEYDCSKASLNLLTKIFAKKYPKAHINAICFGWLDTKMNNIDEDIKKFIDFIPLDRASKEIINLINTTETGSIKVISK